MDIFTPRMPQVDEVADLESVFTRARQASMRDVGWSNGKGRRQVVIVTPNRTLTARACPEPGTMTKEQIKAIETIIPSHPPRLIAAIAYTDTRAILDDVVAAIPFFGLLVGFAYLGHPVWVFEGHQEALAAGCRYADALIIDEAMLPFLSMGWGRSVAGAMNQPTVYVYGRKQVALRRIAIKR